MTSEEPTGATLKTPHPHEDENLRARLLLQSYVDELESITNGGGPHNNEEKARIGILYRRIDGMQHRVLMTDDPELFRDRVEWMMSRRLEKTAERIAKMEVLNDSALMTAAPEFYQDRVEWIERKIKEKAAEKIASVKEMDKVRLRSRLDELESKMAIYNQISNDLTLLSHHKEKHDLEIVYSLEELQRLSDRLSSFIDGSADIPDGALPDYKECEDRLDKYEWDGSHIRLSNEKEKLYEEVMNIKRLQVNDVARPLFSEHNILTDLKGDRMAMDDISSLLEILENPNMTGEEIYEVRNEIYKILYRRMMTEEGIWPN